jgi:hypothetical protein
MSERSLADILPDVRFLDASASCSCPKATLELFYYLSADEEKRYIFEFGKNLVVVRIQSGGETILPFESAAFRHELEDISQTTISAEDGEHIILGLMNRARRCSTSTEPQADTRETLRQTLIEEHYFECGKAPSNSASRVDTTSWILELEEHQEDCQDSYGMNEVFQIYRLSF